MYMKTCGICKNEYNGNGIKYCSNPCAYKAIDLKTKERKLKNMTNTLHAEDCNGIHESGKYGCPDEKDYQRNKNMNMQQVSGTSSNYPKFPTKKNKTYKIIVGFNKFVKYYYETPHGKCKVSKIFLLPIYIINFY
jgi:hypothetical protein